MPEISLPVTRPVGRALLVGSPTVRAEPLVLLQRLGFQCAEVDDPYHAMAEICARPLVYRALILSLNSLYREELQLIPTIKRRFPHVEVWLTGTDGRPAAMAESMRLGADGLLAEDGLHRTALAGGAAAMPEISPSLMPQTAQSKPPAQPTPSMPVAQPSIVHATPHDSNDDDDSAMTEPILSAEELRALLQEQPSFPYGDDES